MQGRSRNRNTAVYPRYVVVYDRLLSDIQSGKYQAGDKLPGENDLAKQFGVSRNTLRQALLILQEDGYVSNHQGKGSFVLHNRNIHQDGLEVLNNPMLSMAEESVDRIETCLEIRRISPKNQEVFGLDASKLLALVEHIYHHGDCRIGCGLSFVPYDCFSAAGIPLDDNERIWQFYHDILSEQAFSSESALKIVTPRDPVTKLLQVSAQQHLFMLDEVIYHKDGGVIMTQKLFMRPEYYSVKLVRKSEYSLVKK